MAIEVRPFEDGAGVEITGLDLSQPLTEEAFAIWRDAFLDQGIVVIRDQHFNAAQHVAFSKWFGPLEDFPDPKDQAVGFETILRVTNIERDGGELRSFDTDIGFKSFVLGTGDWHIDSSFRTNPGKASLLYALEVPPTGGDTIFANTHFAYEALPVERKEELAKISVVHDFNAIRRRSNLPPRPKEVSDKVPPVTHSLVTQLSNGKRVLMIGSHTDYVEAMDKIEGDALIKKLTDWCVQPRFSYHHKWRVGDLVMWDNRCILHMAMPYNMKNDRRLLHRTTIASDSTVI